MPAEPVIVFDLGGVLLDWNPRYLYRQIFADETAMEQFLAEVCTQEWNVQQDAGRPFAEAVALLVQAHPHHAAEIRAYYERWGEMVSGAIEGTVEILAAVRQAGYPLAALSNWSAETFPLMQARYDFLGWFDLVVLSGEERCVKPDPRIYQILLQRLKRPASACIFIDDSEKNVVAARHLGIEAIHFQTPARLRESLMERGIRL